MSFFLKSVSYVQHRRQFLQPSVITCSRSTLRIFFLKPYKSDSAFLHRCLFEGGANSRIYGICWYYNKLSKNVIKVFDETDVLWPVFIKLLYHLIVVRHWTELKGYAPERRLFLQTLSLWHFLIICYDINL